MSLCDHIPSISDVFKGNLEIEHEISDVFKGNLEIEHEIMMRYVGQRDITVLIGMRARILLIIFTALQALKIFSLCFYQPCLMFILSSLTLQKKFKNNANGVHRVSNHLLVP